VAALAVLNRCYNYHAQHQYITLDQGTLARRLRSFVVVARPRSCKAQESQLSGSRKYGMVPCGIAGERPFTLEHCMRYKVRQRKATAAGRAGQGRAVPDQGKGAIKPTHRRYAGREYISLQASSAVYSGPWGNAVVMVSITCRDGPNASVDRILRPKPKLRFGSVR